MPLGSRAHFAPFLWFGRYWANQEAGSVAGSARIACYNLYLALDGTLEMATPAHRWRLRPNQASIMEPGSYVSWQGPCRFIRLAFDITTRPRECLDGGHVHPTDWTPQADWQSLFAMALPRLLDPDFLASKLLLIHSLATTQIKHPLKHLCAHSDLSQLLTQYVMYLNEDGSAHPDEPRAPGGLVESLESRLMAAAKSGGTVSDAAATMGYSTEHLSRLYKRVRGKTPSRFLQEWRVQLACTMLQQDPQLSCDAVAIEVGLANSHSLNRCFHQILGLSPRHWKRQRAGKAKAQKPT